MPLAAELTNRQKEFIHSYRRCGTLSGAAEHSEWSVRAHYYALRGSKYRQAFTEAQEFVADKVEETLLEMALQEKNMQALMFMAKSLRPEKFRENHWVRHEVGGVGGGPVAHIVGHTTVDEVQERLREQLLDLDKRLLPDSSAPERIVVEMSPAPDACGEEASTDPRPADGDGGGDPVLTGGAGEDASLVFPQPFVVGEPVRDNVSGEDG